MEKARVLEAMGEREAIPCYTEIIDGFPQSQEAKVAEARRARAAGNLAGAYKAFVLALASAPQDVELINEMEDVRQRQRPELTSRAFAYSRGESQADESHAALAVLPARPGSLWRACPPRRPSRLSSLKPCGSGTATSFTGGSCGPPRVSGLTKVVPVHVAVEYRGYHQIAQNLNQGPYTGARAVNRLDAQTTTNRADLRMADFVLGAGPVNLANRIKLSGELIFRKYWKRVDRGDRPERRRLVPLPAAASPDR